MTFKGFFTAAAAVAMTAAPVAVSAAPANRAAPLSLAGTRAATPVVKGDKAIETSTLVNIGILAALVVGVLVFVAGDDDDDSDSN